MNRKRIAILIALCLTLSGCQRQSGVQTTPTATESLSQFESYVAQTTFSFPKSWSYDDEDDEDANTGLQAAFTFTGGTIALQFLWMDDAQAAKNVFLQQIDMDDVQEQAYAAGPYVGKLISGTNSGTNIVAFEGCRSWYDQKPKLYLRVILNAVDDSTYQTQKDNLLAMLSSMTVLSDTAPAAIDMTKLETYDFTGDFGLVVKAPRAWMLSPEGDSEHQTITLSFDITAGDNLLRVELATVEQKEYDQLVQSLKSLKTYEDVYEYSFSQKSGAATVTCLQEGKINRTTLLSQKTGGKIRYLLVNSMLRPVLDEAYYQSTVVPVMGAIQWKK